LMSDAINPRNALQRSKECHRLMTLKKWTRFEVLMLMTLKKWPRFEVLMRKLTEFQGVRVKSAGRLSRDDEFTHAPSKLRVSAVDSMLQCLELSDSFDDFMAWMTRLSDIVGDPQRL